MIIKRIGNIELFCFSTALLGTALYWSFALISISSFFLAVLFVFQIELYPTRSIRINPRMKSSILDLLKNPLLLCFVLLFLLGLLSFLWSNNTRYCWNTNQLRVQLLFIPVCILAHEEIPKNYFYWILRAFIAAAVISASIVLYYFVKYYDLYIYAMQFGKTIYTPVQHIRFTAMLVMSFGALLVLIKEINSKTQRIIYGIAALFLFLMIHLLSVKGSILSLYFLCIVLFISFLSGKISKYIRYPLLVLLMLLFGLSLVFVPSLSNKLKYVKFEISEFKAGRWQNLSDLERLISYQVGWELAMKNPITGVGLGDFEDETKQAYLQKWNLTIYKLVHNELLFQFMSLGIGGLLLFLGIYYFTIKEKIFRKDFLCLSFIVSLFALQLFNDTLESQISVGMTMFALIVIWNRKNLVGEETLV